MSPKMLLALAVIASQAAWAADPVVRWDGGRLAVQADDVSLGRVLEEIARAAGATLRGAPPERRVTIRLDDVTLESALETLAGRQSFALVYGPDGRLAAIDFLAAGTERAPSWPPPAADTGVAPERQREVMGRPIAVSRRLGAALGTRRPAAGQVIQAALRQKSARARAEAEQRVLDAFARDPELEDVFHRTLAAVEDATLARLLDDVGGRRAEQFMSTLAARAPSDALRAKAAAVLDHMRAPTGEPRWFTGRRDAGDRR